MTGEERPRRDWLNANLGYVTTSRARAKVAHWFKLQAKDQNAEAGREMVQRELHRLALDGQHIDMAALASTLHFKTTEDMYAALGAGDLRLSQIINEVQQQVEPEKPDEQLDLALPASTQSREPRKAGNGVRILGVGNLLTSLASCCKPIPGDPIMGYITQGRGISIHREDCSNLLALRDQEPGRVIDVEWGDEASTTYPVDIQIEAFDRSGLLRDVMMVLGNERINVLAANTATDPRSNLARLSLTIEITRLDMLGRIMDKINQIQNVMDVHRERRGSRG